MTLEWGDLVLASPSLLDLPLEEKIEAAGREGFQACRSWRRSISVRSAQGRTPADIVAMLDHHGLEVQEIEAVSRSPCGGAALEAEERNLCAIADAAGRRVALGIQLG